MQPRFECPSARLTGAAVSRGSREALGLALTAALVVHLTLGFVESLGREEGVSKPLTTQFVKRHPRLTKPLELKKRPLPRRRRIQRRMVSVKARVEHGQTSARFEPGPLLSGLARPAMAVARVAGFGAVEVEPTSIAETVQGTKDVGQKIDMSLELLDVQALDTGRHHAMVIVDPTDKRGIKGFLHLGSAYPVGSFPRHEQKVWAMILPPLVGAMNKYTDIRTDVQGKYSFDSRELFKMPWLYSRHYQGGFRLTDGEARNLGQYLLLGGFLFAEGVPVGSGQYTPDTSLRQMVRDALASSGVEFGRDWEFQKLPNSHAIYHCYFNFDSPPIGSDWHDYWPFVPYLEGVEAHGRTVVLLSDKNYAHPWVDWGRLGSYRLMDNTRQLQFGVNSIIFALTQEGSITHRLMDSIK